MSREETNHLTWIYNRLIHVYGENPNYDYMIRFNEIIDKHIIETNTIEVVDPEIVTFKNR